MQSKIRRHHTTRMTQSSLRELRPYRWRPARSTRRSFMGALGGVCAGFLLPRFTPAQSAPDTHNSFVPSPLPEPPCTVHQPRVEIVPTKVSSTPVYDLYGNHWALAAPDGAGNRKLLVLPAQQPQAWGEETLSHLPGEQWIDIVPDEVGFLWIASPQRLLRLDPHAPTDGWLDLTSILDPHLDNCQITALGVSPSGMVMVALRSGWIDEIGAEHGTVVRRWAAPANMVRIAADGEGSIWAHTREKAFRLTAAPDAWQRHWQLVARLPGGNHDLSGDVLHGRFYMAGGQSAGWGYPAVRHAFDQIFKFNPVTNSWRIAARLANPRFYNGTSHLEDKIWVIAGNRRNENGEAVYLSSVEICDPSTGSTVPGPATPLPIEMPVAVHIGGRIYVAGGVNATFSANRLSHTYDKPGMLISIGAGEKEWRKEPDGYTGMSAMSGAALGSRFYLSVPSRGLVCYDTQERVWQTIPHPRELTMPRSPQMAAYRGEIWMMGGRDVANPTQCLIYNPAADSWRSGPALPFGLSWGAAAEVGGRLALIGGATGRFYSNATYLLRE